MGTEGNALTGDQIGGTRGNSVDPDQVYQQSVTDPTLGNGDGTYEIVVPGPRTLEEDSVVGVTWDGSHRATLDSVSGSTVTVLFDEPDGASGFTSVSDGQITGTLSVAVID